MTELHNPSAPLLEVRNLSVRFSGAEPGVYAARNVSFDIRKGETLALVGESGSGKTVCALSILRLLPYPDASHPSGQILFEGQDLLRAKSPGSGACAATGSRSSFRSR